MRRILLVVSLFFLLPLCAKAQETPTAEVYGGYSFLHAEKGRDFHGWNGSVCVNLNKWFGVVADASGHYDATSSSFVVTVPVTPGFPPTPEFPVIAFNTKTSTSIHTVMVGPRFSYRKTEKLTPFAHALFGVSRAHTRLRSVDGISETFTFSDNNTTFAMAIGAGLDVKISKLLALRVIQADYLYNQSGSGRLSSESRHNLRAGVGLVFRFGGK